MNRVNLLGAMVLGCVAAVSTGCESGDNSATTQPSFFAAYKPTSGQNLAPGIAPYNHGDPNWPMDAGNSGGGGGRR